MTESKTETAAPKTAPTAAKPASKAAPKASKSKPKAKPAPRAAAVAPAAIAAFEPAPAVTETMEEVAAFQKANVEAFMTAGKSWAKGMSAFTGIAFEMGRKNYERAISANKEIMACESIQDAFEIRAELAREFLDSSLADATQLSELVTKTATEAAEPLHERYNLALDGMWKAA